MEAQLEVRWEQEAGQTVSLSDDVTTIGRTLGNRIVLGETTVSRHHAQILREGDCYWLFDLGSANGSYLNDKQLTANQPYALNQDDLIRIGPFQIQFSRKGSTEANSEIHDLKILVAEDNRVNQQVVVRLLKKLGYDSDVVGNGLAAIEAVHKQPYDVILMDLEMPEMDGITATKQLNQEWSETSSTSDTLYPRPWIIALTAYATQEDQDRCRQAGMNGYLTKPIRIAELERALQQCGVMVIGTEAGEHSTWITASGDTPPGIQGL